LEIETLKILREKTGAGVLDCKIALKQANGQLEPAMDILRQKGLSQASKKADRATGEGLIYAYIHSGGKIGVLLEVNCETDFVARNEEFQSFVRDLGLHIAGSIPPPQYVRKEDAPPEQVDSAVFLMEMPFIKDPSITIREMVTQKIAKIGENIVIRRFTRYQLGE
jgi:elongation factor Ts